MIIKATRKDVNPVMVTGKTMEDALKIFTEETKMLNKSIKKYLESNTRSRDNWGVL